MVSSKRFQRKAMAAAIVLLWFSNYVYVPILSTYAVSRGASLSMVGMILGSYGFIQMVSRIPIGILSDSLRNRRIFLQLGMVASIISGLGFYFFTSPGLLLLFRLLAGLAVSNWAIYITTYTILCKGDNNSKAIGTVNSLNSIGHVGGVFLGGVIAQYINVETTFLISALAGFLGFILLQFVDETYEHDENKKKVSLNDFVTVFRDSELIFYSSMAILFQIIVASSLTGFVPNLLSDIGANDFQKGLGTTLASLPTIFAAPLAVGFFSKKFGSKWSGIIGFSILSASMFIFPYIKNISVMLGLEFIAGFGKGLLSALLMACATSHLPAETRSTALSIYQAVYSIGMSVGPAITGKISNMFSLRTAFVFLGFTGVISILILLIHGFFNKRKADRKLST
ncbi:MAG: MFS transporter [Clostridiaceae bacterium]|nr:MFS transporter [Clostridiaceae bacterium]